MIKGRIKKTDNYTIETKMIFRPRRHRFRSVEKYTVETWFFLPVDMGINKRNYTKTDFYRELKSYIKIDPPKMLLEEMADAESSFMQQLSEAYRMFDPARESSKNLLVDKLLTGVNIFKKAMKREVRKIELYKSPAEKSRVARRLLKNTNKVLAFIRSENEQLSKRYPEVLLTATGYVDEYLSNLKYRYFQQILYSLHRCKSSDEKTINELKNSLSEEIAYRRKHHYPLSSQDNNDNDKLVRRWDLIKYYVTNKLILNPRSDKEMKLLLEVLYSIAAGIAMIFATAVAFYYGRKFGNFTYGLFVVLVISYMFKDRIKEWGRNFFNNILNKQMLDHRFILYDNNQKKIGVSNTGFNFIPFRILPKDIKNLRYEGMDEKIMIDEKVMKFTRKVKIHTRQMRKSFKDMGIRGINDVLKFNYLPLTLRLEDPGIPLYLHDEAMNINIIRAQKTIPVNMILVIRYRDEVIYHHYKLLINRNGIKRLKAIKN